MRRALWFFLLLMLTLPRFAQAIQLHWAGGATDLTVSSNTQAILVIQADSAEVTLPNSWRLQWTTDSLQVQFSAFDPNAACLVDTAKVDSISPPMTPADSAANLVTAYFCSDGSNNAATAYFLADIIGGSKGKMKVVALDPADTTQVIESNEVTFNGGVDGDYATLILNATSEHAGELLTVTAVGTGLTQATAVSVGSQDDLWTVPLSITRSTNSKLVATASVPSQLPAAVVKARNARGTASTAPLAAEQFTEDLSTLAYTTLYTDPNIHVYPKDFAFYFSTVPTQDPQHPWQGVFHLFYIRHFKPDNSEPYIAHVWSTDLTKWNTRDSVGFLPGTSWDSRNVWAPSIIKVGNLFYMFYTGVDNTYNQRLGYVTATHLDSLPDWSTSNRRMIYDADSTHWATPTYAAQYSGQQFRDPFIMEDPDTSGRYMLYQIGEDRNFQGLGTTTVGVAKNRLSTMDRWLDYGPLRVTDSTHVGIPLQPVDPQHACDVPPPAVQPVVESPMAMRDSLTHAWRVFFTNANYNCAGSNSTWFVNAGSSVNPADTTLSHWSGLTNIYSYLGNNNELLGWAAMKHLQVGNKWHFFAAYDGTGIAITQAHWDTTAHTFIVSNPNLTGVGRGGDAAAVRFYLPNFRPGTGSVRMVLVSPTRSLPRVVVYDVAGRAVRTITDGSSVIGTREYVWDLRDRAGAAVHTGIYFARLTGVGRPQVLRMAVVR